MAPSGRPKNVHALSRTRLISGTGTPWPVIDRKPIVSTACATAAAIFFRSVSSPWLNAAMSMTGIPPIQSHLLSYPRHAAATITLIRDAMHQEKYCAAIYTFRRCSDPRPCNIRATACNSRPCASILVSRPKNAHVDQFPAGRHLPARTSSGASPQANPLKPIDKFMRRPDVAELA